MMPRLELDADQAVQDVLNAWGANRVRGREPRPLNADFSALFDKMMAPQRETVADSRRAHNRLTTEEDVRASHKESLH